MINKHLEHNAPRSVGRSVVLNASSFLDRISSLIFKGILALDYKVLNRDCQSAPSDASLITV